MVPTSTSAIDLINFSQGIAQLNLGYLGISVLILGFLGGVFAYFNIKPLKDALEKQERTIEELKKEAQGLLTLSAEQSEKTLKDFRAHQSKLLIATFEQQNERLKLETANKIQEVEKILSTKIEKTSEDKDIKLREIILSEAKNHSATLEKELTLRITTVKESITKEVSQIKSVNTSLKSSIKKLDEKVKELQVYKYHKEGQMGAIILSIELLKDAVDEYLENKKLFGVAGMPLEEAFSYRPKARLEELIKEIGDLKLEQDYISQIDEQLSRLAGETTFLTLIDQLKEKLK